jgi:glutathione synthase
MVVEADEDNIFDQAKVARALEALGSRVLRLTLTDIDGLLDRSRAPACWLRGIGPVQVLYFRTGYNLADYLDGQADTGRLLHLRGELETLNVTLAPTIALQLASAKAVQASWYADGNSGVAAAALDTEQLFLDDDRVSAIQDWSGWLLKSQGEGGGNVIQGDAIPARIQALAAREKSDWLLMRRIELLPRTGPVPMLRQGTLEFVQQLVSELGLFVLGDDLRDGGYLLRSKPAHALETGVHRGEGMIDAVAFDA